MAERNEPREGISFNPRDWGSSEGKSGPKPAEQRPDAAADAERTASFNPRTWVEALEPADSLDPVPLPRLEPDVQRRFPTSWLTAGGALVTAVLGAAAFLMWPAAPQSGAPVEPAAEASGAVAGNWLRESQNTLPIATLEDLAEALAGSGVGSTDVSAFSGAAKKEAGAKPGPFLLVFAKQGDRINFLQLTREDGSGVHIARSANGLTAERFDARLEERFTYVRGTLGEDDFYSSAVSAGLDASLTRPFADAFAFDVDMQMDVKPDDVFEATIAQNYNPAGVPVGQPRLLYVSLRTALYWFDPGDGEAGWFDGNGSSIIRNLMRTPLNGARVTSRFGPRTHPITGFTRVHRGTDYAAPIGTPVYASGGGVVIKRGWGSGGAGQMVALQHDNGWLTKYLHLSAFAPGVEVGQRVSQGDIIAESGNTGGSTGPHLHYEVWIDGEAIDPQTVDTGTGKQLAGQALADFKTARDKIDAIRAQQGATN